MKSSVRKCKSPNTLSACPCTAVAVEVVQKTASIFNDV